MVKIDSHGICPMCFNPIWKNESYVNGITTSFRYRTQCANGKDIAAWEEKNVEK